MINRDTVIKFIKFGIVGGSGVVVNQGLFSLLIYFNIAAEGNGSNAQTIAILVSIFTNFLLNNFWTWKENSSNNITEFWVKLFKFFLSALLTAILFQKSTYIILIDYYHWDKLSYGKHLANFIGIGIASVSNFLISHFWTFKQK
jgi:dolichol-phosphate mannosyltransferase